MRDAGEMRYRWSKYFLVEHMQSLNVNLRQAASLVRLHLRANLTDGFRQRLLVDLERQKHRMPRANDPRPAGIRANGIGDQRFARPHQRLHGAHLLRFRTSEHLILRKSRLDFRIDFRKIYAQSVDVVP